MKSKIRVFGILVILAAAAAVVYFFSQSKPTAGKELDQAAAAPAAGKVVPAAVSTQEANLPAEIAAGQVQAPALEVIATTVAEIPEAEGSYPARVTTKYYSPEGQKLKLGLVDVTATQDKLVLTLSLDGIDFANDWDKYDAMFCDPYLAPKENVSLALRSYNRGDTSRIVYEYELKRNSYRELHFTMDWTIGPCAHDLNSTEFALTPVPEYPLLVNSHFEFSVPVK